MANLDPRDPERTAQAATYAAQAAYESLTFPLISRAGRELSVTLSAEPVIELATGRQVSRRIRRCVRHLGGERRLTGGARPLEPVDLSRIDLQTLKHGLDLLRLRPEDSGVVPAFWRTIASSRGRFALLCAEIQHASAPGALLVEVTGGLEQAPPDAVADAISHFETAALGVVLHVVPDPAAVHALRDVHAHCLALDFAGVAHDAPADWPEATRLIQAGRRACAQVLLVNLRPERAATARDAGATHAVFAALEPLHA